MAKWQKLLGQILEVLFTPNAKTVSERPDRESSPGQFGASATVEVSARELAGLRMEFAPEVDCAPDPGEVIWTWVPFEENDGRGKDRPVLILAHDRSSGAESYIGVYLTSREHTGNDYVGIGSGPWDPKDRPSWVNLSRVFRVFSGGMRREGAAVSSAQFATVKRALN